MIFREVRMSDVIDYFLHQLLTHFLMPDEINRRHA